MNAAPSALKGWRDYAYEAIPADCVMMRTLWLAGQLCAEAKKAGHPIHPADSRDYFSAADKVKAEDLARMGVAREDLIQTKHR